MDPAESAFDWGWLEKAFEILAGAVIIVGIAPISATLHNASLTP
jgi:hypothetical protein